MFKYEADTAFILGAGFSAESKLPVTSGFARALFDTAFGEELDKVITEALKEFLTECFRWKNGDPIPTFEDMFTMIDISAEAATTSAAPLLRSDCALFGEC